MTIEALKSEVLKLGTIERIEFIQFILDSLAKDEKQRSEFFQLSNEQKEVAKKRMEDIKNGTVNTTPHQEVEERIKKKYGFNS